MIRVLLAATLAGVCLVAAGGWLRTQPTDPILGTYRVDGADPNGPYHGTVTVSTTGEAYALTWTIASAEQAAVSIGFAIWTAPVLSAIYQLGNGVVGVSSCARSGDGFTCTWSAPGQPQIFRETWTKTDDVDPPRANDGGTRL